MPNKKRSEKSKHTWKNKKTVVIALLAILLAGGSVATYMALQPKKSSEEKSTSNSNSQEQTNKTPETQEAPKTPETPAPETPKTPETPKEPEKKPESEAPTVTTNLPEISKESPKLTRDKIEKIKLEMSEDEVKSVIGNDTYESAKKAGQEFGSVTLNLSDSNGGVILGFDQGKLISLTRTYALNTNTADSFTRINKGMSKEEVVQQLGLPTTEMGKQGTIVYSYQYKAAQGLQTKVVVFDINDKVLVVQ